MGNLTGYLVFSSGAVLLIGGIMIALFSKNIIKMIIGFTVAESGVNVVLLTAGYIHGKEAPIMGRITESANYVDPLPQALVLTSIVIGLAVTALFMFYAYRFYKNHGTLNRDSREEAND